MLVHLAMPDAPCIECHEDDKPKIAIGTQPIQVER